MAPRARTSPRKQPKQDRARETVDAILAATTQILVKHGYEAANTNRIAEAAGVSIGSLYQYFPSKEALVVALIERHCERMWALTLERTAAMMGQPLPVAARHVIGALFAAHAVEPRLHKVLHEQVPRVGKMCVINEVTDKSIVLAQSYLELHRDQIIPKDTAVAALVIVHIIEALAHAALDKPDYLQSGVLLEETSAVVLRYLTGKA
jgi:AcrR family transcriptional regulator